jgi:hypothetical protein
MLPTVAGELAVLSLAGRIPDAVLDGRARPVVEAEVPAHRQQDHVGREPEACNDGVAAW